MLNTVAQGKALALLTRREWDVLRCIARDTTDRGIAAQLGISERTVRAHVSRIIAKLGVTSRVGAAVAFVVWEMRCAGGSATVEEPIAAPAADMTR